MASMSASASNASAGAGLWATAPGKSSAPDTKSRSSSRSSDDICVDHPASSKTQRKPTAFISGRKKLQQDLRDAGRSAASAQRRTDDESDVHKGFKPPKRPGHTEAGSVRSKRGPAAAIAAASSSEDEEEVDPRYRNVDKKAIETIKNEMLESNPATKFDDIAGLAFAKQTIKEIIILPMLNPALFRGLRSPPKGLLLFGPPGTGKTMIGR